MSRVFYYIAQQRDKRFRYFYSKEFNTKEQKISSPKFFFLFS